MELLPKVATLVGFTRLITANYYRITPSPKRTNPASAGPSPAKRRRADCHLAGNYPLRTSEPTTYISKASLLHFFTSSPLLLFSSHPYRSVTARFCFSCRPPHSPFTFLFSFSPLQTTTLTPTEASPPPFLILRPRFPLTPKTRFFFLCSAADSTFRVGPPAVTESHREHHLTAPPGRDRRCCSTARGYHRRNHQKRLDQHAVDATPSTISRRVSRTIHPSCSETPGARLRPGLRLKYRPETPRTAARPPHPETQEP